MKPIQDGCHCMFLCIYNVFLMHLHFMTVFVLFADALGLWFVSCQTLKVCHSGCRSLLNGPGGTKAAHFVNIDHSGALAIFDISDPHFDAGHFSTTNDGY